MKIDNLIGSLNLPTLDKGQLRSQKSIETVNNPKHYNSIPAKCSNCNKSIECIDVVRHLDFNIGNAMKYLWRFKQKGGAEDLRKAAWYIKDEISRLNTE